MDSPGPVQISVRFKFFVPGGPLRARVQGFLPLRLLARLSAKEKWNHIQLILKVLYIFFALSASLARRMLYEKHPSFAQRETTGSRGGPAEPFSFLASCAWCRGRGTRERPPAENGAGDGPARAGHAAPGIHIGIHTGTRTGTSTGHPLHKPITDRARREFGRRFRAAPPAEGPYVLALCRAGPHAGPGSLCAACGPRATLRRMRAKPAGGATGSRTVPKNRHCMTMCYRLPRDRVIKKCRFGPPSGGKPLALFPSFL
jgi:hypothetical protein